MKYDMKQKRINGKISFVYQQKKKNEIRNKYVENKTKIL